VPTPVLAVEEFAGYSDVTMDVARQKKFSPIVAGSLSSSYDVSPHGSQRASFQRSPPELHAAQAAPSSGPVGVDLFKTRRGGGTEDDFPLVSAQNEEEAFVRKGEIARASRSAAPAAKRHDAQPATTAQNVKDVQRMSGDDVPLLAGNEDAVFVNGNVVPAQSGPSGNGHAADALLRKKEVVKSTRSAPVAAPRPTGIADDDVPLVSHNDDEAFLRKGEVVKSTRSAPVAAPLPSRSVDDDFPLVSHNDDEAFLRKKEVVKSTRSAPVAAPRPTGIADDDVPLVSHNDDEAFLRKGEVVKSTRAAPETGALAHEAVEAERRKQADAETAAKKAAEEQMKREEQQKKAEAEAAAKKKAEADAAALQEAKAKRAAEEQRKREEEERKRQQEEMARKAREEAEAEAERQARSKRLQEEAAERQREEEEMARKRAEAMAAARYKEEAAAKQNEFEAQFKLDLESGVAGAKQKKEEAARAKRAALAAAKAAEDEKRKEELKLQAREKALHRERLFDLSINRQRQIQEAEEHAKRQQAEEISRKEEAKRIKKLAEIEACEKAGEGTIAETGILYKAENRGVVITGIKSGTDAATSDFKVGDVIIQLDDDLVVGMTPYEFMNRMRGERGSEVELVATRMQNNGKKRVSDLIERDVVLPPMQAEPGVKLKVTSSGATVTQVFEATSADHEGMQVGDQITMIDEEFVSGLDAKEIEELMRGLAGTDLEIVLSRMKGGKKQRHTIQVVRDHNLIALPLRSRYGETGPATIL